VSRGRQIITAEASILDSSGRLLSHGTSTVIVFGNGNGEGRTTAGK
jgi:acyl-coenzyme A thioesterase PaaI-like protein